MGRGMKGIKLYLHLPRERRWVTSPNVSKQGRHHDNGNVPIKLSLIKYLVHKLLTIAMRF